MMMMTMMMMMMMMIIIIIIIIRVSENRLLVRIFGPKRKEDGSWRKFHNDELHILYSSPNIVRVIK
jgi:hypothetical protein